MRRRSALPVDELLDPVLRALGEHSAVVVEAPPGSGKTTRIPLALLESPLADRGEIWVAEPRRVAARLAARYVAELSGTDLGDRVGYSVRFEERASAQTRLRFVTEGVLLRRLTTRAPRGRISVVVLDEFHERHLESDLNLMLLRRGRSEPDAPRLVVMSATLNGEAIARHLGDCPRLRCDARSFPLTVEHQREPDDRPLPSRVASAVRQLLAAADSGNVLAFLPGRAEIRETQQRLRAVAERHDVDVLPLYGEMPLEEQSRAVAGGGRRRVVLATNVAESSVTVEGVTRVIDSGLARVAEHSPWTGRQVLDVQPISKASAIQRAGRAGRTRAGHVVRLFTEADFNARPEHDKSEVQRQDLTGALLLLHGAGVETTPDQWLDAPSDAALEGARTLLGRLGLLTRDGDVATLTPLGRRALGLSVSPRLARVVLEGERLGIADEACLAAALLSEGDPRRRSAAASGDDNPYGCECDVERLMDLYREAEQERFSQNALRRLELRPSRVDAIRRSHRQLRGELGRSRSTRGAASRGGESDDARPADAALGRALLAGFPDRVARRRKPGHAELVTSTGQVARLDEGSVVRRPMLLLAVEATEHVPHGGARRARRGQVVVRLASPIEAEWLLDLDADSLSERRQLGWDESREAVMATDQLCWGAVVVEQSQSRAEPGPEAAAILRRAALARRRQLLGKHETLEPLLRRLELAAEHLPELGLAAPEAGVETLLEAACEHATSLAELREIDLAEQALSRLSAEQRRGLFEHVPEHVRLPGGRRLPVRYPPGRAPYVESRLQDFFGMSDGPSICRGRVPLTLHLLAPNRRAVQVTTDLAGFWERHYPDVRKQLRRRYPKHAWPEDGRVRTP